MWSPTPYHILDMQLNPFSDMVSNIFFFIIVFIINSFIIYKLITFFTLLVAVTQ